MFNFWLTFLDILEHILDSDWKLFIEFCWSSEIATLFAWNTGAGNQKLISYENLNINSYFYILKFVKNIVILAVYDLKSFKISYLLGSFHACKEKSHFWLACIDKLTLPSVFVRHWPWISSPTYQRNAWYSKYKREMWPITYSTAELASHLLCQH